MEISSELRGSSSSSSSSCSSNGVQSKPPTTPTSGNRSQNSADPTTFIQADPSSFKQLVQMLTGSTQTLNQVSKTPISNSNSLCKSVIPPIRTGQKKQVHKLYERRNSFKSFKVSPIVSGLVQNYGLSPRELEMLSPSMLNFPSLMISPVTPLSPDPFDNSPVTYTTSMLSTVDQESNTDKGIFVHFSPVTTPRNSEPRLLPLFPLTSPKVASTSF